MRNSILMPLVYGFQRASFCFRARIQSQKLTSIVVHQARFVLSGQTNIQGYYHLFLAHTSFYRIAQLRVLVFSTQINRLIFNSLVNWVKSARILRSHVGNQRECWESTRPSSVNPPQKGIVARRFCKFGARPSGACSGFSARQLIQIRQLWCADRSRVGHTQTEKREGKSMRTAECERRIYNGKTSCPASRAVFSDWNQSIPMFRTEFLHDSSKSAEHSRYLPQLPSEIMLLFSS